MTIEMLGQQKARGTVAKRAGSSVRVKQDCRRKTCRRGNRLILHVRGETTANRLFISHDFLPAKTTVLAGNQGFCELQMLDPRFELL